MVWLYGVLVVLVVLVIYFYSQYKTVSSQLALLTTKEKKFKIVRQLKKRKK